jgi:hypothetical protein
MHFKQYTRANWGGGRSLPAVGCDDDFKKIRCRISPSSANRSISTRWQCIPTSYATASNQLSKMMEYNERQQNDTQYGGILPQELCSWFYRTRYNERWNVWLSLRRYSILIQAGNRLLRLKNSLLDVISASVPCNKLWDPIAMKLSKPSNH